MTYNSYDTTIIIYIILYIINKLSLDSPLPFIPVATAMYKDVGTHLMSQVAACGAACARTQNIAKQLVGVIWGNNG